MVHAGELGDDTKCFMGTHTCRVVKLDKRQVYLHHSNAGLVTFFTVVFLLQRPQVSKNWDVHRVKVVRKSLIRVYSRGW